MVTDEVGSVTSNFYNFVRATLMVRKFSNSTRLGIASNLDMGHDEITDSESDNRARCVGTFTMDSMTFFN